MIRYINGTATVRRIAELANVDHTLARECIQHLVYVSWSTIVRVSDPIASSSSFFGCCIVSDLFQFSNSYALVGGAALTSLGGDTSPESFVLQEELEDYVRDRTKSGPLVPSATLLQLYAKLTPGLVIHDWHVHSSLIVGSDV